jgi:hypothetical protein
MASSLECTSDSDERVERYCAKRLPGSWFVSGHDFSGADESQLHRRRALAPARIHAGKSSLEGRFRSLLSP